MFKNNNTVHIDVDDDYDASKCCVYATYDYDGDEDDDGDDDDDGGVDDGVAHDDVVHRDDAGDVDDSYYDIFVYDQHDC